MSILVFGSINMDLVVQSPRLPQPGETLVGRTFATMPGGKGANQAVAAARQGAPTVMVGRVGDDDLGQQLRQRLATEGVNTESVMVDATTHTGVAAIAVADNGENQIVIVPGANGRVGDADWQRLHQHLDAAQLLLLQYEIPATVVAKAAELAHAQGIPVILDPAPVPEVDLTPIYPAVDILTPNQVEAAQLTRLPVGTVEQAREALLVLQQQGAQTVIIKLGAQGVLCGTADGTFHVPAFAVDVVDTVAAGDAFNGGLAVALQEGQPLREAVTWASATAAVSVTQSGAQPSLPTRSQVADLINPSRSR